MFELLSDKSVFRVRIKIENQYQVKKYMKNGMENGIPDTIWHFPYHFSPSGRDPHF